MAGFRLCGISVGLPSVHFQRQKIYGAVSCNRGGTLNPMGNQFIAYSIKDKLIELLDPERIPYQQYTRGSMGDEAETSEMDSLRRRRTILQSITALALAPVLPGLTPRPPGVN